MLSFFFFSAVANAYPQFIGYQYKTCITCHFNSQGGGQISDYGRAVWATEIADRTFFSEKTPEELGQMSGFLFKKELPWWLRLGAKTRQIWIAINPFQSDSDSRDILMQADANVAFFFTKNQKFALISTLGYAGEQLQNINRTIGKPDSSFISREHYLRVQATEDLWIYGGKLDTVYGIRHANHDAFSRRQLGLSASDQSYGVIGHYIKSEWELTLNLFVGDLQQEKSFRAQGASMMFEYDLSEKLRVGTSLLNSKSDVFTQTLWGVHSKSGVGHGLSFIFDGGFILKKNSVDTDNKTGYYIYSEAMQRISRGYHLFVTGQAYKSDMTSSVPDETKFGFGFLIFPMQRVEFRMEVENANLVYRGSQKAENDWVAYGQVHMSM